MSQYQQDLRKIVPAKRSDDDTLVRLVVAT